MNVNDLTIVMVVLGATWAAMFHVLKGIEIQNAKRDLILKINKDGWHLTKDQRNMLLYNDFLPIWIGAMVFCAMYSGGFAALPHILSERSPTEEGLTTLEWTGCYLAAGLGLFALAATLITGCSEIRTMRRFIVSDAAEPENDTDDAA